MQNQLKQIEQLKEIEQNKKEILMNIEQILIDMNIDAFQTPPEEFNKFFIGNFLTLQHNGADLSQLNQRIRRYVYANYFQRTDNAPYQDDLLNMYFTFQIQGDLQETEAHVTYKSLVKTGIIIEENRVLEKGVLFQAMSNKNINFFPQDEIEEENYRFHFNLFCYGVKRIPQVLAFQKTLNN